MDKRLLLDIRRPAAFEPLRQCEGTGLEDQTGRIAVLVRQGVDQPNDHHRHTSESDVTGADLQAHAFVCSVRCIRMAFWNSRPDGG